MVANSACVKVLLPSIRLIPIKPRGVVQSPGTPGRGPTLDVSRRLEVPVTLQYLQTSFSAPSLHLNLGS